MNYSTNFPNSKGQKNSKVAFRNCPVVGSLSVPFVWRTHVHIPVFMYLHALTGVQSCACVSKLASACQRATFIF